MVTSKGQLILKIKTNYKMAKTKSINRKIKRGHIERPLSLQDVKVEEFISGYYTDPILGGCEPIWKKRLVLTR